MGRIFTFLVTAVFLMGVLALPLEAKQKRKKRRYYPPLTHPVVLWGRTLSQSSDKEQRKVAAFKLSQYSLLIFQDEVIQTLIQCMKDGEDSLRVLCAKAMQNAGRKSDIEWVRKTLLEEYSRQPILKNTIVRTFIARKDSHPTVHDRFLEEAEKITNQEDLFTLIQYFELYGSGSNQFVKVLSGIYKKFTNPKIKRLIVKAFGEKGQGQDEIVNLLTECVDSKDTPLILNCLSALQTQAKNDRRSWLTVQKALPSDDIDVLLSTLDLIISMNSQPVPEIVPRLMEIINDSEDPDIQERAVLALGMTGNFSFEIVDVLKKMLERKDSEAIRIAAALALGNQAVHSFELARGWLSKCQSEERSQSLRTACNIGLNDLERNKVQNLPAVAMPKQDENRNVAESLSDSKEKESNMKVVAPPKESTVSVEPTSAQNKE